MVIEAGSGLVLAVGPAVVASASIGFAVSTPLKTYAKALVSVVAAPSACGVAVVSVVAP